MIERKRKRKTNHNHHKHFKAGLSLSSTYQDSGVQRRERDSDTSIYGGSQEKKGYIFIPWGDTRHFVNWWVNFFYKIDNYKKI